MRATAFGLSVSTVLWAWLLLITMPGIANATVYYVATTGDDTLGTGLNEKSPWKTIQKAAKIMVAGDKCLIRGGTYRESVTPANSGREGAPITFQAYDSVNEPVTISGADRVTGSWTQYKGSIYRTSVNMDAGNYNQVFVDGEMNLLAQWPNDEDGDPFTLSVKRADVGSAKGNLIDNELNDANDPSKKDLNFWNGAKLYISGGPNWFWQSYNVSATEFPALTQKLIYSSDPADVGPDYYAVKEDSPYYLAGNLNLLDTAKEWYYNSSEQYLYLMMPGGATPLSHAVEFKKRNLAFDLRDRSYIVVEGLSIFASAVNGQRANNCTINKITAKYLNHSKVLNLDANLVFDSATDVLGINFVGDNNRISNSEIEYSGFNSIYTRGKGNIIVNNYVKKSSYNGSLNAVAIRSRGRETLIGYNTVEKSGRVVLAIETLQNSEVKYNNLSGALAAHLNDFGVLSASQTDYEHTVVHHNFIHDNLGRGTVSPGLFTDNSTSNLMLHHNVIWNGGTAAMHIGGPSEFNHFYNNTLIGGLEISPTYDSRGYYKTRFVNNIVTGESKIPVDIFRSTNIDNSTAPGFTDPVRADYSLQWASAAIDAGTIIPGITDGYVGNAPDIGAFEYGVKTWTAGHDWTAQKSETLGLPPALPYRNLVLNAGFQEKVSVPTLTSLDKWTTTGEVRVLVNNLPDDETADCRHDETGYYVQLGGAAEISQAITGLRPYTTYTLSALLKVDLGEIVSLGAKDFGGTAIETTVTTHSALAQRYEVTFKTGTVNDAATIYIKKTSAGGGYACVDDVGLVENVVTRLDLATMYRDGSVNVDTDMTWTNANYPGVGIGGAFDGSIAYFESATKGGGTNSFFKIALNKIYEIAGVGICLKPGYTESARIYLSTDGIYWVEVKKYTNTNQSAVDSTLFLRPSSVRYVQVVVNDVQGGNWPQLTELELYTPVDLKKKFKDGSVTVQTDMNFTYSVYPDLGIAGALDGSTDYWHSATAAREMKTIGYNDGAKDSYYTITLDRVYDLRVLGISLKPGYPESATIEVSMDDVKWIEVRKYNDAVHSALDYTRLPSALRAKFVRVKINGGKEGGWPTLNEIVLYE